MHPPIDQHMLARSSAFGAPRFEFSHPSLRKPGLAFVRDEDRQPCLSFDLGDVRGTMPLRQVAANFSIPHAHPDIVLLSRIDKALRFSRSIKADDPLPTEMINGTPSWTPRAPYLLRAAVRLGRALGARHVLGGDDPDAMLRDLALAVRDCAPCAKLPVVEMAALTRDAARVEWLCRAVVTVQRLLGGLAKAGADRGLRSIAETTRSGALALRAPTLWASDLAMRADAMATDLGAACRSPGAFRAQLHPLIATLRAFVLDIEPLIVAWNTERDRPEGASAVGLERVAGLAVRRYAKFRPSEFEWNGAAPVVPAGAFDV
jgi:hypothetical protein